MANLTNAMVETKQQGIEEYDLTFSRYWCLIFGLSVLYLTLICTAGKNSRFSTGFRIEAPFTKLHGFIDTLEGETARELEDSMTISGWSSTKAINLHICKLNSELVYPWTVTISKRKGCSSNHDLYIYIYTKLYVYFTQSSTGIMTSHWAPALEDPGGAVVASAQRHRGVQRLATLLAATEKARCAAARLDSDGREDFLRFGNCFPKVPVLIFIFESWYISHKDYPLRCNQSRFKAVGNR